jgi:hypothetical protein
MGYYGLLEFTSISVPNQSLADMCPLLEWCTVDLHHDVTSGTHDATSGGDRTFDRLVSAETFVVDSYWASATERDFLLLQNGFRRCIDNCINSEGQCVRRSFIGGTPYGLHHAFPTVAPRRQGSILMSRTYD